MDQKYYSSGYDRSISSTHEWRTTENSCAYMLHLIKPTDRILDVGCGPGTITVDFAKFVPHGEVVGIEPTHELITLATELASSKNVPNVDFHVASAYKLPFEDNSFDIIHAHQVLLHLEDPVLAMREMLRVVKPTGYVCCRDADTKLTIAHPEKFDILRDYFNSRSRHTSTNAIRGRSLRQLAIKAGFKLGHVHSSASTWCISNDADRLWFSKTFISRVANSAETYEGEEYKKKVLEAWEEFIEDENGWLTIIHGEVVCQKDFE